MRKHWKLWVLALVVGVGAFLPSAVAADGDTWLAAMETEAKKEMDAAPAAKPAAGGWEKPIPISLMIDYTIVTDYIWRGLNFSDYAGERPERLNHQLTGGISYDTGVAGEFGFSVWLEFYGGQRMLDSTDSHGGHLQEVDYTLYWSYDLSKLNESIPLSVEIGWIAYTFPEVARDSDGFYTNEVYYILSLDDSKLFGTENAVLNPYFAHYMDLDDFNGSWMEFGISHDFALADLGMADVPVLKDLTLSPSLVWGIDHNFYNEGLATTSKSKPGRSGKATSLATMVYGLSLAFDASSAFGIPEQYGALSVTGFVNYSQPMAETIRREVIADEFWGGMSITWEW